MKKLLIICSLFAINMIVAMDVENNHESITLPSAATLITRLHNNGFEHFAQTTGIVTHLANKKILPEQVKILVSFALHEYPKHAESHQAAFQVSLRKKMIIRLILQDCPEALHSLKIL